ncbi:MAG: hypothetical protein P8P30_10450 [Rickettsiales bacterium]|nr:hypothetical protein [Rickettsiales bacterium]
MEFRLICFAPGARAGASMGYWLRQCSRLAQLADFTMGGQWA